MRHPNAVQSFSSDPLIEHSLSRSLKDGVFFAAMIGGGESYFSAFAVFLKAGAAQLGVLASLPPLLASFMQLLSSWLGRRLGKRRPIIVFGASLQALALFPLALLPLFFADYAVPLLTISAVIYFCGPNLGQPQWGSLMGDLVPADRRGRFFALRTRWSSVATFLALIAAGLVLQGFHEAGLTYWGFVTIFALAAVSRFLSVWQLHRMHDPGGQVASLETPWHHELWRGLTTTSLLPFSLYFGSMQFAVAIASPFFTLYMLRELHFNYAQFMLSASMSVCMQFLTLNRWGRLSDIFGNRLILITTGALIPFVPALWLVSTKYLYILGVQAAAGLLWAGFTLSASNFVFDLTPPERRSTLMAVHNVFAAAAVFSGAVLGGWLGTHLPNHIVVAGHMHRWLTPLYGVFGLSAFARCTVAAVFLPRLKEVRRVKRMSPGGLIFRVTRVQPVSGLMFEVMGRARSRRHNGD